MYFYLKIYCMHYSVSFDFGQIAILVAKMTKPIEEIAICPKSKLPKIKADTVTRAIISQSLTSVSACEHALPTDTVVIYRAGMRHAVRLTWHMPPLFACRKTRIVRSIETVHRYIDRVVERPVS